MCVGPGSVVAGIQEGQCQYPDGGAVRVAFISARFVSMSIETRAPTLGHLPNLPASIVQSHLFANRSDVATIRKLMYLVKTLADAGVATGTVVTQCAVNGSIGRLTRTATWQANRWSVRHQTYDDERGWSKGISYTTSTLVAINYIFPTGRWGLDMVEFSGRVTEKFLKLFDMSERGARVSLFYDGVGRPAPFMTQHKESIEKLDDGRYSVWNPDLMNYSSLSSRANRHMDREALLQQYGHRWGDLRARQRLGNIDLYALGIYDQRSRGRRP